ncbi:MAG: zf-HC2 domain-containing protein [Acidimicrobiales bacterium]
MTTHDEIRHGLGAYVTGALDPAERAETDDHLADCQRCRDEVLMLSPLPTALLRVAPPGDALVEERIAHGRDDVLSAALAHTLRNRARRRRAVASGAVVLVAAAATAIAMTTGKPASPAPARTLAIFAVDRTAARQASVGTAALNSRPWGTQIVLTLRHLGTTGRFLASVSGPGGSQAIGGWRSTPNGNAVVELATALRPAAVKSVTITSATGTVLLRS